MTQENDKNELTLVKILIEEKTSTLHQNSYDGL